LRGWVLAVRPSTRAFFSTHLVVWGVDILALDAV